MRVLVVASQKGGSGKTTLAGHIAVQAEMSGFGPVAVIDMDPQGGLTDWWSERQMATPLYAKTAVADLGTDIEEMKDMGIKLLIIDTPPAIAATIAAVVQYSDLVVIPTRPSPHDLRAVGATIELVERLGKKLVFVINGAAAGAKSTMEAISSLSECGAMSPAVLHQRADFSASMIDGRTVMEVPGGERSAMEIKELWDYLRECVFSDESGTDESKKSEVA